MDLLREREKALSVVARRLGTSSSGLRRWVTQAEIDEGRSPVLTSEEREGLTCLRRALITTDIRGVSVMRMFSRGSGSECPVIVPSVRSPQNWFRPAR